MLAAPSGLIGNHDPMIIPETLLQNHDRENDSIGARLQCQPQKRLRTDLNCTRRPAQNAAGNATSHSNLRAINQSIAEAVLGTVLENNMQAVLNDLCRAKDPANSSLVLLTARRRWRVSVMNCRNSTANSTRS